MTNPRRQPTQWERKFFAGDSSALDDPASNVHDFTDAVLALLTGTQPWEVEALALISEMQQDYQQAKQAFADGDLLACTEYVIDGSVPKTDKVSALVRRRLVDEGFMTL